MRQVPIFRSLDKFRHYYYPKKYEREKIAAMSTPELVEYLARRVLTRLARKLDQNY